MKKVTTAGTPLHGEINLLTDRGTFHSYVVDQDGRIGIRTEFVANTCDGPGRMAVGLEFDENGNLQIVIYDRTNKHVSGRNGCGKRKGVENGDK